MNPTENWAGSSFTNLKILPDNQLAPDYIQARTHELALAAKDSDWCPNGGWQFPFDFGHGDVPPDFKSGGRRFLYARC